MLLLFQAKGRLKLCHRTHIDGTTSVPDTPGFVRPGRQNRVCCRATLLAHGDAQTPREWCVAEPGTRRSRVCHGLRRPISGRRGAESRTQCLSNVAGVVAFRLLSAMFSKQDASVYAACIKQLMSRGGPAGPLTESTHDSLAWLESLGNRGIARLLQVGVVPTGLDRIWTGHPSSCCVQVGEVGLPAPCAFPRRNVCLTCWKLMFDTLEISVRHVGNFCSTCWKLMFDMLDHMCRALREAAHCSVSPVSRSQP